MQTNPKEYDEEIIPTIMAFKPAAGHREKIERISKIYRRSRSDIIRAAIDAMEVPEEVPPITIDQAKFERILCGEESA